MISMNLSPRTQVIVLSASDNERVFPSIKAGASGYLLKDVPPDDLQRVRLKRPQASRFMPVLLVAS